MDQGVVQVGRYRLIAELAHGGMGDVYLGVAQGPAGFSKLMVIKMLRPALADDEQFLAMFLEEARLAARLNHPNIVQTVEVGNEGRRYFLAMEYLEGQSLQRLRQRVAKEHPFPLGQHIRIIVEALNGLQYAHELVDIDNRALGIVHRDATPHNIFVTYDGQVKVVDFGIAKAMDSSLETRTGELKGKVAYMPPEQASAQRVDRRADVFALGVMVWEAAVGRRLWKGLNEVAIMHELLTGNIPSPRSIEPSVPPELDAICKRALAMRADDRYATAADFAQALERFLANIGDRTTSRDIATLTSTAFAADRRELREIIDNQLRTLRSGDDAFAPMPKLPAAGGGTPSLSLARPSTAQLDQNVAPSYTAGGTASSASPSQSVQKRGPLLAAAAMIAAAVGLLGVIVFLVVHNSGNKTTTGAPQPVDTATHPNAETTELSVTTTSPAQLFLDDAPLGQAPYHNVFPRDGIAHRIRAEAPSPFAPRTEIVVFDKPQTQIELTLTKGVTFGQPIPPPTQTVKAQPIFTSRGANTTAPTATGPKIDTPVSSSTGHKPPRSIDTSFGP
ncbi:MAG TPA: serine/threonine-protein kinase [Polyangiaceae bacterium]